jgi:hypothetical protein
MFALLILFVFIQFVVGDVYLYTHTGYTTNGNIPTIGTSGTGSICYSNPYLNSTIPSFCKTTAGINSIRVFTAESQTLYPSSTSKVYSQHNSFYIGFTSNENNPVGAVYSYTNKANQTWGGVFVDATINLPTYMNYALFAFNTYWTGANGVNCNSWTSSSSVVNGVITNGVFSVSKEFANLSGGISACNQQRAIVCSCEGEEYKRQEVLLWSSSKKFNGMQSVELMGAQGAASLCLTDTYLNNAKPGFCNTPTALSTVRVLAHSEFTYNMYYEPSYYAGSASDVYYFYNNSIAPVSSPAKTAYDSFLYSPRPAVSLPVTGNWWSGFDVNGSIGSLSFCKSGNYAWSSNSATGTVISADMTSSNALASCADSYQVICMCRTELFTPTAAPTLNPTQPTTSPTKNPTKNPTLSQFPFSGAMSASVSYNILIIILLYI